MSCESFSDSDYGPLSVQKPISSESPLIEPPYPETPKRTRRVAFENTEESGTELDGAVSMRRTFDENGAWKVDKVPVSRGAVNDFTRESGFSDTHPSDKVSGSSLAPAQALGWILRDWDFVKVSPFIPIYLIMLGFFAAVIGTSMDILIHKIVESHKDFMNLGNNSTQKTFLWTLFVTIFSLFGIFATHSLRPNAVGSGIPEMKSMLSGVPLYRYLSVRTLFAKIIGLTCAIGGGLVVGKEGPFVHIASIIANQLAKLPILRKLRYNPTLMQQMLAAACAAGVAGNFGAPIGGVLFSIEVTASYYNVANYWSAFLSAIVSASTYRYIWNHYSGDHGSFQATVLTDFGVDNVSVAFIELVIFIIVGIICGVLGVLFIKLSSFLNRNRPKLTRKFTPKTSRLLNLYGYAFIVSLVVGIISCPKIFGEFMALSTKDTLTDLFNSESLDDLGNDWGKRGLYADLIIFVISHYILCALCISISIPCGLFVPILATGGGIGRIAGELMLERYPDGVPNGGVVYPGGYALAGAAALASGVTQTLSSAVIVFEVTGQLVYLLPVLLSVMFATGISRVLTPSIYDTILLDRGLPFMPPLKEWTSDITAKDLMVTHDYFPISSHSSISELSNALINNPSEIIPVVTKYKILRGCIKRTDLEDALVEYLEKADDDVIAEEVPQNLFLSLSKAKLQEILSSDLISKQHLPISPATATASAESRSNSEQDIPHPLSSSVENIPIIDLVSKKIESLQIPTPSSLLPDTLLASPIITEGGGGGGGVVDQQYNNIIVNDNEELVEKSIVKIKTGHLLRLHSLPIQLTEASSLATMHQLFIMNRLSVAFVTNTGILIGMVKRSDVSKYDGTVSFDISSKNI